MLRRSCTSKSGRQAHHADGLQKPLLLQSNGLQSASVPARPATARSATAAASAKDGACLCRCMCAQQCHTTPCLTKTGTTVNDPIEAVDKRTDAIL